MLFRSLDGADVAVLRVDGPAVRNLVGDRDRRPVGDVAVDSIDGDVSDGTAVTVTDEIPDGWTVDPEYGDVRSVKDGVVDLGTVTPADVAGDGSVTRKYFAEAPEGADSTGSYTFGPAVAEATIDGEAVSDEIAGTETAYVAGASTST